MICKSSKLIVNSNRYLWGLSRSLLATATIVGLCFGQVTESGPNDDVSFQVITDKPAYSPHSRMLVKFLITNIGPRPIYIFSGLNSCSSLYGYYDVHVLDDKGGMVPKWVCAGDDVWPGMQTVDPVAELHSPQWVELKPGDIYGRQEKIEAPSAKGRYRITAELRPPQNFGSHQKEILQENHLRVLVNRHEARSVDIKIE